MNYELKDTILYLDNVVLGYDGVPVLKDINIIEKDVFREGKTTGQIIAIIGRSGRGKSTLFKALTGLVKPISGKILITELDSEDGTDAKEVSEGDIGFVDQKYTLFRHKTIVQIFNFALRKSKKTKQEKEALINKYLVEWGLLEHKDKYPSELSGGQRQRVSILEQLLCSKHYMVFDEPCASLDVHAIETFKNNINLISKENELNTIIFSTHDINLAIELSDSVYILGHPSPDSTYSTVIKHYDLKEMGLAWKKFGVEHLNLVNEIKNVMFNS